MKQKGYYIGGFALLLLIVFWSGGGDETPPADSPPDSETGLGVERSSSAQDFEDSIEPAMPLSEDSEEPVEASPEPLFATVRGVVQEADTENPIQQFKLVYLKSPPAGRAQWRGILGSDGPDAGVFTMGALVWHTFNDEQGRFELKTIPGGKAFALAVKAEGYEPAYVSVSAIEAGAVQDGEVISLALVTGIRGRVVNTVGDTVSGASIYQGENAFGRMIGRSDSQGHFRLTGIEEDDVSLYADHRDYLPSVVYVSQQRGDVVEVEIVLGDGGSIAGTVRSGESAAPNVQVTLHNPVGYTEVIHTDLQGQYRILGVPPGEVEVMVEAPEGNSESRWVLQRRAVVSEGLETRVDIQFPAFLGSVSGQVTVGGEAVTGGVVQVELVSESGDVLTRVPIDGEGQYRIDDMPNGNIWMHVMVSGTDGIQRGRRIGVALGMGEDRVEDIDFGGTGTIEYTVVSLPEGVNGTLLLVTGKEGVSVGGIDLDSDLKERVIATRGLSAVGDFTLGGLESGDYTLAVIQPGSRDGVQEIRVLKAFPLAVGGKEPARVSIEF